MVDLSIAMWLLTRGYGTKVSNLSVHPKVGSIQDLNQPGVVHLLMAGSFGESQMVGIYVYDKSWNIYIYYIYMYIYISYLIAI